jgi:hypothetical protein
MGPPKYEMEGQEVFETPRNLGTLVEVEFQ